MPRVATIVTNKVFQTDTVVKMNNIPAFKKLTSTPY